MNTEVTAAQSTDSNTENAAAVVTAPKKPVKARIDPKVTLTAVVTTLGSHGPLSSKDIFQKVSPHALEVVRKHGTYLAFGWYSLEHYFGIKAEGEAPTPVPEGTKIWKERQKKTDGSAEVTQVVAESTPETQVIASTEVATVEEVLTEQPPVVAVESTETQAVVVETTKPKSKGKKKVEQTAEAA